MWFSSREYISVERRRDKTEGREIVCMCESTLKSKVMMPHYVSDEFNNRWDMYIWDQPGFRSC